MQKNLILAAVALLLGIVLGLWIMGLFSSKDSRVVEQDGTVLLEKITKVAKLVTVEGYFSEMYSYKDYYKFDIWPLRKKALLRVKARVTAGVDLEGMTFEVDDDLKVIRLKNMPKAEILYMETDFDYYDLTEGAFNNFAEKDHTALQKKAKTYIMQAAAQSDILKQADEQTIDFLETIRFIIEASGWTFEVKGMQVPDEKAESRNIVR